MRDCCIQKMLKETETEETMDRLCVIIFIIGFNRGRPGPAWLHLWFYDYRTSLLYIIPIYYNIESFYALQRKITNKFVERCHLSKNLWLKIN